MTTETAEATSLLINQIGALVVVPPGPLIGAQMHNLRIIHDAALLVRDGRIAWFGSDRDAPIDEGTVTISGGGGTVIPGLIDPHTHIPFVGDRSGEFARRLAGETYLQIMEAGGGIRSTTRAVRAASLEELVSENLPRLHRMLALGVTRVECKSGYGLTVEDELKQLEATRLLDRQQPIDLDPTYLGPHALPAEYEDRADEYIDYIASEEALRRVADRGLARFCDVFCDQGAFTVAQSERVLTRAAAAGLRPKIHADELAQIGASKLAGQVSAVSADHLEHIDDAGIAALKQAGTVAVALPGTSFFLGIEHCNARQLIAADLPVALATDFNPGSSMIESLPLIMWIACCQLRMTPTEILAACTANAAAALAVQHHTGAIAAGYDADLVILGVPSLDHWFYTPGRPRVRVVIKKGHIVYRQAEHAV